MLKRDGLAAAPGKCRAVPAPVLGTLWQVSPVCCLTPSPAGLCLPRVGVRRGQPRWHCHPVSLPQGGGSWVLISGVYSNEGRMGAALMSPDGKSLPRGGRAEQGGAIPSMEQVEDGGASDQPWLVEKGGLCGGGLWEGPRSRAGCQSCKNSALSRILFLGL